MIEILTLLAGQTQHLFAVYGAVFLRIGAVFALLPGLGERSLPGRVRLGLAFAVTAVITPVVAGMAPDLRGPPGGYLWLLLTETLAGLTLGFMIRLFLFALQTAGEFIAQSASLAQMFQSGGEAMPAVTHLLTISGLGLIFALGLHLRFVEAIILSYRAMPAGELPTAALMQGWALPHIARAFELGFSLAAPFIIVALFYNVALGIVSRAMPGLMISFIGAPALSLGALVLLAVAAPFIIAVWAEGLRGFLGNPFEVLR